MIPIILLNLIIKIIILSIVFLAEEIRNFAVDSIFGK